MTSRLITLLALVVLLAGSCASDDARGSATAQPTSTTAVPIGEGSTGSDVEYLQGAAGVGDPYGPGLGNGGYDVQHYDLDVTWDPSGQTLTGEATIVAAAAEPLGRFNLDLESLDVASVLVDGSAAEWSHEGRELIVTPAEPLDSDDEFEVTVSYGGQPEPVPFAGAPTAIGWIPTSDGGSYVLAEPAGAAGWFPSNDHPSDKATFSITARVPDGLTAVSNGTLVAEESAGGTSVFTWESRDPMATYLATVVIGEFEVEEYTTEKGLAIRNYFPIGLGDVGSYEHGRTPEMIDYFEDLFGPYPFEAYGVVVIPEEVGVALEAQTMSLFGAGTLTGRRAAEWVAAHELAHQWVGNSVTPTRWQDIWLNEGLATYADLLWQDEVDPDFDLDAEVARPEQLEPLGPPGDPGPAEMFDDPVYYRGAMTIHALRLTLGDEVFFDLLRTWTGRFEHGNATTDDFIALSEEISGEELDEFFEGWLYAPTTPDLPGDAGS